MYHVAQWRIAIVLLLTPSCSTIPYQAQIGTFGTATADMVAAHAQVLGGARADQQRLVHMAIKTGRATGEAAPTPAPACVADDPGESPCVYLINLHGTEQRERAISADPPQGAGVAIPLTTLPIDINPLFGDIPSECTAAEDTRNLVQAKPEAVAGLAIRPPLSTTDKPKITEGDIFNAFSSYADALKAISSSDDRAAMDKATNELAAAVTTIVSTVGLAAGGIGAAAGPAAGAAVKLGGTIAANIEQHRRFEALRENLVVACVPVRTLVIAAGLLTRAHRDHRRMTNALTMSLPRQPNLPKKFDMTAAYTQGWAAADSSQTLSADPLQVAKKMITAHNKLVVAIAHGRGQDVEVIRVVDEFARAAKAFRNALSPPAAEGNGSTAPAKANPS